jgi:hypothetical protein
MTVALFRLFGNSELPGTLLSTLMLVAVGGLLFRAGRGKTA